MFTRKLTLLVVGICLAASGYAYAKDIPYRESVRLKVGQTVVLKGVRGNCDDKTAPNFARLTKLPKPKLGILLDGGAGTVDSESCNGRVPGRAVKFKATKSGKETITIYKDKIRIQVD